jgi:tetratricopeptide (TPR) repeat protein
MNSRGHSLLARQLRSAPLIAFFAISLSILTVAATTEPADSSTPDHRAEEMLRLGDYAGAAQAYAEILDGSQHNGAAISGRIRALLLQDLWQQALEEAREHYAMVPDDPICVASLGEALFRAGLPDEAKTLLESLVSESTPTSRALMTLARLNSAAGNSKEATNLMDQAVALSPTDRELLLHASSVAADRPEAIRRLEQFLELSEGADPDRVTAAKETLEMLRELGDQKLWVRKTHPERLELPLRRVFNASRRQLGYVVEVRFGAAGKPVRLLLDTGASGLHITERVARKNGFKPLARTTLFGGGNDQRHATRRGIFTSFAVGDLEFTNALASMNPNEFEPTGRFHGLLGISVFDGYRVTLDLKKQRLVLEPPPTDDDGSRYWMFNGQMLVRAGSTHGQNGLFLFDTGAGTTLLDTGFVERVPRASLDGTANVRAFGGAVQGAQVARGVQITYQDLNSKKTELRAIDLSLRSRLGGVQISGFLGLDLIKTSRIIIDTNTQRLQVLPAGSK